MNRAELGACPELRLAAFVAIASVIIGVAQAVLIRVVAAQTRGRRFCGRTGARSRAPISSRPRSGLGVGW
jgi:hypothetical protein